MHYRDDTLGTRRIYLDPVCACARQLSLDPKLYNSIFSFCNYLLNPGIRLFSGDLVQRRARFRNDARVPYQQSLNLLPLLQYYCVVYYGTFFFKHFANSIHHFFF